MRLDPQQQAPRLRLPATWRKKGTRAKPVSRLRSARVDAQERAPPQAPAASSPRRASATSASVSSAVPGRGRP